MQEDLLQPHLTVHEAMCIAANLKLGDQYTLSEKLATVSHPYFYFIEIHYL